MKIMIWNAAKGGMRSVVESYIADGFIDRHHIKLIHSYSDSNVISRQFLLVGAIVRYIWTLSTNKIELVHVHSAMRGSFWRKSIFLVIAKIYGVPVLFHLHGSEMKKFYAEQNKTGRRAIQWVFEAAKTVLVLSRSWQDFVMSIAPQARVVVVPNYVKIHQTAKLKNRAPLIVFLGLIGKRKGVDDLLLAMQAINAKFPSVKLIIGGNGKREEAEELARTLSLNDCVEFAGWVGPEDRANLLSKADIYVLPSYNEGLPMGILEAMSFKVAIVSTTVGGIPELIQSGENGILIKPGDVEALVRALDDLLSNPENRLVIAQAGFDTLAGGYSDKKVIPILDAVYEECRK